MNANFFKIEREAYIEEIMKNNPNKMIVLIFSLESNFDKLVLNNTFTLKKYIKKNLANETEIVFLFINLQQFLIKENKYSHSITKDSLPYVSFYYNFKQLARITTTELDVFKNTLEKLKEFLENENKEKENNDQDQDQDQDQEDKEDKEVKDNNENKDQDIKEKEEKPEELNNLTDQIRQQRKIEEIEKLKQQYLINELTKLKKAKEIQERIENND
jgi:hypothetical protein